MIKTKERITVEPISDCQILYPSLYVWVGSQVKEDNNIVILTAYAYIHIYVCTMRVCKKNYFTDSQLVKNGERLRHTGANYCGAEGEMHIKRMLLASNSTERDVGLVQIIFQIQTALLNDFILLLCIMLYS